MSSNFYVASSRLPADQLRRAVSSSIQEDHREIDGMKRMKGDLEADRPNHGTNSEAERELEKGIRILDSLIASQDQEIRKKMDLISVVDRVVVLSSEAQAKTRKMEAESVARGAGRITGRVLGGIGRRLSALETEDENPRPLPTFKSGGMTWTVDSRLREFRSVEYGKTPKFVPFDSDLGRQLGKVYLASQGRTRLEGAHERGR